MTQPTNPSEAPPDAKQGGPQGHPIATAVGTGIAISAIAHGLPDPWLPLRWLHLARIVKAERAVYDAFAPALHAYLDEVRPGVVDKTGVIDQYALARAKPSFARAVDDVVDVQVREVFEEGFQAAAGWEPDANFHTARYLDQVRNRMSRTPDHVFAMIRQEVQKATNEGAAVEDLALKIQDILSNQGVATWKGRGLTVARTETISAYNAGTFAGMTSLAAQLGGEWEKAWLSTHDTKTRPTHRAADIDEPETGQRVPLHDPFMVGGFACMFPGDPSLPPEECINCRCTLVMLEPGEKLDTSNRHFRRPA